MASQAAQFEGSAEHTLSFGRRVPETAVRRIARTTAWLDALAKATETLSASSLVQWGAGGASDSQALVSAVFTPTMHSMSKGQQVSVRVRLATPQRTVEDRLRKMLHEREMLALRTEMLNLEKEKAEEAHRLIKQPVAFRRAAAGGRAAHEARLVVLAEQLEALWLLGITLPQREGGRWRDPQEALPVLQQAVALDPEYAPLQYLRGEIFLQLDRPQDALADFDKALALNPELAGALYARGLAYLRLQLPTLAERDLSAALARDASHAAWWRARGALRMIRNEIGPMCEDFAQACARGDCEGLALARERGVCLAEK
ncbi:MAG: tetratricopeptide repeat protein [Desulfovibrionaceae bacterium]|nr:tetratricopeptide repeat protein [Desulfovibrionaceae bacterium]